MTVDVPEEYLGVVTQLLALRKGRMEQIINHGTGWVRLEHLVPARGLVGFRTELLTETRGTGLIHHVFERHGAVGRRHPAPAQRLAGGRPHRGHDRVLAASTCRSAARCSSGRASRSTRGWSSARTPGQDDMDVNPTKEKKLTNIRSADGRELREADPAPARCRWSRRWSIIADDECVEVTPKSVRLRKVVLDQPSRARAAKRAKALTARRPHCPSVTGRYCGRSGAVTVRHGRSR